MSNNVLMSTKPDRPPTQTNTNFESVRGNVSLGKYATYRFTMGRLYSFPEIVDMAFCSGGCSWNATTVFKRYRDKTVIGEWQFVVLSFLLTTDLKRRIRRKTANHQYQKFYSSDRYSISHASVHRTLQDQPLCPYYIGSMQELHLQDVHSVIGSCDRRGKTLRLQQRFYVLTNRALPQLGSPIFTTSIYGQLKTLMPFDLIIISDSFPSVCGLEV